MSQLFLLSGCPVAPRHMDSPSWFFNRVRLKDAMPSSCSAFHSYLRPEMQSRKHRGGSSLHLVCPGPSGCLYYKRENSGGLGEMITLT